MEVRLAVEGADEETTSLLDWLGHEETLRGRVGPRAVPPPHGVMGSLTEIAVLMPVAAGAAATVARSVAAWLAQRRSDVTVVVRGADGAEMVRVAARRVDNPAELIEQALSWAGPPAGTAAESEDVPAHAPLRHRLPDQLLACGNGLGVHGAADRQVPVADEPVRVHEAQRGLPALDSHPD